MLKIRLPGFFAGRPSSSLPLGPISRGSSVQAAQARGLAFCPERCALEERKCSSRVVPAFLFRAVYYVGFPFQRSGLFRCVLFRVILLRTDTLERAHTHSYTRFWFAMANSFLGEALLSLAETRPHLLFRD